MKRLWAVQTSSQVPLRRTPWPGPCRGSHAGRPREFSSNMFGIYFVNYVNISPLNNLPLLPPKKYLLLLLITFHKQVLTDAQMKKSCL